MSLDKLKKKAERGSTASQIMLGHHYLTGQNYEGEEIEKNYSEAFKWFAKASEQGAFTGMYHLGMMYEEGLGLAPNLEKAIECYKGAVELGAYLPCIHLARIYAAGKGVVSKNETEAMAWYQKVLSFEGVVDDEGEMEEARRYLRKRG